jgi:nucleoside-diphosphate-sugar epimerase
MNVLVTGATGFVGRHVVARLLERGHEVVAVARDEAKARTLPWFGRARFVACDIHGPIGDPAKSFGRPDAVMHLAWPGLPNYGELFHYEQTLPADYRFLKSLVLGGVKHLLVTGTCVEYGMQDGALAENTPAAPLASPYALAKDTLRKELQSLQQQHAFTLQWARLFYMHGEGQNPTSLLAQLDRAIDAGETAFNMSGGEQLRDYLPVTEVAARAVTLLEHPGCDGIVNICSGEPISVRRLVERHLAQRGASIRLNLGHYPYSSDAPMAFWGDASRLAAILQDS